MIIEVGLTKLSGYTVPVTCDNFNPINLSIDSFDLILENLDYIERCVALYKAKDRAYYETLLREKDAQINILKDTLALLKTMKG